MKNRKAYAIICWMLSVVFFFAALLISEGKLENLTKQVIFLCAMGIVWLILGVVHWVKGNNQKTN
mgnify:CR=1 FL=1